MSDSPESQARAAWPALRAAAASYGVNWIKTPGKAQVRLIAARIREDGLTAKQLEQIIHGYIVLRGTTPDNGFNPLSYLRPKTLYRESNWPDYLGAGEAPPKAKQSKQDVWQPPTQGSGTLLADMDQDEIDAMIEKNKQGTQFEH
jgi:hypothetical protein